MPFFNMFKSRRGRSTSLPRAPERYLHESEVYNQYGPRSTSGFGRPAHPAQPQAGFRAQRNPSHSSSFSNSVPERYAESPTNDQVRTTACRISHPQCHEHLSFHNKTLHIVCHSPGIEWSIQTIQVIADHAPSATLKNFPILKKVIDIAMGPGLARACRSTPFQSPLAPGLRVPSPPYTDRGHPSPAVVCTSNW